MIDQVTFPLKTLLLLLCFVSIPDLAQAWQVPVYHETVLESIYPAGGQQGTSVSIRLYVAQGGMEGATGLVVDGPPGVEVESFKVISNGEAEAKMNIAPDAAIGSRMIRVRGGKTGLTNFRYFLVGQLPEHIEKERNNEPEKAEVVNAPVVINGQVRESLDQDTFRFQANQGQKIVAAVASHRLDAMGYNSNMGFFDSNLELLDAGGNVLAESGDALGFDPLILFEIPQDGDYLVRVSGVAYKGFPQAVYRLTLGEVPYPIAAYPAGGKRGETVVTELVGPNVPVGTTISTSIPSDTNFPVIEVSPLISGQSTNLLSLAAGDFPEIAVQEEHSQKSSALPLKLPVTVNARFQGKPHEHWYKLTLKKKDKITLEIISQQLLRSPIDTLLQVYDDAGELVAANDDGEIFASECVHDFVPFDSRLEWSAQKAGDYFVCVSEQTGRRGPLAAYRLIAHETKPDFRIYQFPDAVPIWGPGGSATVCIETTRLGNLKADIELEIIGLPEGWTGSKAWSLESEYKVPRRAFGMKTFLTITAPKEAKVGDLAEFQIVGRAKVEDTIIEHTALPLTLYMWQEPNHFRVSPFSRAAVAPKTGPQLTTTMHEFEVKPGMQLEIPVELHFAEGMSKKDVSLTVNRAYTHFKCAMRPPMKLDPGTTQTKVPVDIPESWKPGVYSVVVALAWASETRKGLPGPCTKLIHLRVPE